MDGITKRYSVVRMLCGLCLAFVNLMSICSSRMRTATPHTRAIDCSYPLDYTRLGVAKQDF